MTQSRNDYLFEQRKLACELHQHEDNLFWQKFNNFVTMTGILASGLGLVWTNNTISDNDVKVASISISAFGILLSILWTLIQGRAQQYHHYRIAQANQTEQMLKVNDERVLTLYEKGLNEQKLIKVNPILKVSTTRLTLMLGAFITVLWAALLISFSLMQ